MSNTFGTSFSDIKGLYENPCSYLHTHHPHRFQSVLRQQFQSDDYDGKRGLLQENGSRFINGRFAGIGSDGFVLRIHARAYYERRGPQAADGAWRAGGEAIVKVRKVPDGNKPTVIRELFVGVMVRAHSLPFLSGISRWWLWNGIETHCGAFTDAATGGVSTYLPDGACDITDFLNDDARAKVRAYHASSGPLPQQYIAYCRNDTAGRYRVMLEFDSAGSCSLDSLLLDKRVLCTNTPNNWHFFRSLMMTLGQQLSVLQERCEFIHGDMSASNVVMSARNSCPADFRSFFVVDQGVFRALQHTDLCVGACTGGFFPTMIDLSRASLGERFVHSTMSYNPSNSANFNAVAWKSTHGATERAPVGAFLPALDIHRMGLSLAHLVFRALRSDDPKRRISVRTMDVRILNVIIRMLDVPATWMTYPDFHKPRPGNLCGTYAKTDRMHQFLVKLVYLVDTLCLLADAIRSQNPDDYERVKERKAEFTVQWEHVNYDLNDWLGWIKKNHPDCDRHDICRPEYFVRWDLWCQ